MIALFVFSMPSISTPACGCTSDQPIPTSCGHFNLLLGVLITVFTSHIVVHLLLHTCCFNNFRTPLIRSTYQPINRQTGPGRANQGLGCGEPVSIHNQRALPLTCCLCPGLQAANKTLQLPAYHAAQLAFICRNPHCLSGSRFMLPSLVCVSSIHGDVSRFTKVEP